KGRVLGAPAQETERTRELDNEGVVQLQKQMMQEQDMDLDELAKIVRRQKEMGIAISDELDLQNEMLTRVDEDVTRERKSYEFTINSLKGLFTKAAAGLEVIPVKMSTSKNIGGSRTKGDLSEQVARQRTNTIARVKEAWGVSELVNIFPREIRPSGELGSTTVANLRTISNLCPDLKKAQNVMLSVSKNPDGSYKIFTFSTSKAVLDRLKEARDMLSTSDTPRPTKKKGVSNASGETNTPTVSDTSAIATPTPSPVKGKKAKAKAAGQELLLSVGRASVEPAVDDDDEGNSITVDTAPKPKSKKKARVSLLQDKPGQIPTATMTTTAPVAGMSTDGPQAFGSNSGVPFRQDKPHRTPPATMVATAPVAIMTTPGSQASDLKGKPLKKVQINVSGQDSDSEDSGSENTESAIRALNVLNGTEPTAIAGKGQAKPAKAAASKVAANKASEPTTIGRMVVPSKNLLHPFRTTKPKLPEQSESSNPPTDKSANNKPAPKKKPFANLMTMAPVKPKTSETLKRPIQKGGDTMSGFEMEQPKTTEENVAKAGIEARWGIQNVDATMMDQPILATQQASAQGDGAMPKRGLVEENPKNLAGEHAHPEAQHGTDVSAAETNNGTMTTEDSPIKDTVPSTNTPRTQLPTSPSKKRTASTMLTDSHEPSAQVNRSTRARLESNLTAPYNAERMLANIARLEDLITTLVEAAIKDIPASNGTGTEGRKAADSKIVYEDLLASFVVSVGRAKDRVLEIAARDEE
ncbi:hypothetical protein V490_04618, partial [Pseudogymnoascus sp. VKM F-3557]